MHLASIETRSVTLHGNLKARFGGPFSLAVMTPAECVRALCSQIPEFRNALAEGEYRVLVRGAEISEDALGATFGGARSMDIVPVPSGAKKQGIGKIILGAALIAAAFIGAPAVVGALGPTQGLGTVAFSVFGANITYANIALFGVSTLIGGLTQSLTPTPALADLGSFESAAQNPGFLFSGPINTVDEGGPVPIVVGRALIGSQVVSAGFTAERVPT